MLKTLFYIVLNMGRRSKKNCSGRSKQSCRRSKRCSGAKYGSKNYRFKCAKKGSDKLLSAQIRSIQHEQSLNSTESVTAKLNVSNANVRKAAAKKLVAAEVRLTGLLKREADRLDRKKKHALKQAQKASAIYGFVCSELDAVKSGNIAPAAYVKQE